MPLYLLTQVQYMTNYSVYDVRLKASTLRYWKPVFKTLMTQTPFECKYNSFSHLQIENRYFFEIHENRLHLSMSAVYTKYIRKCCKDMLKLIPQLCILQYNNTNFIQKNRASSSKMNWCDEVNWNHTLNYITVMTMKITLALIKMKTMER